nr:allergin-1 isoform X6 [Symphalangus syndactylus]
MWSHLNRLLFWSIFSSVTCKKAVLDCEAMKTNDPVTAPVLNIMVMQIETDRHITLHCLSVNGSLPINYTFFENHVAISPAISKYDREPAEFNLTKKNPGEKEEYRCEAKNRLPNYATYSQPVTMPSTGGDSCPFCLKLLLPGLLLLLVVIILILAFWVLPKYKARKAMRNNVPRDCGGPAVEVGIYANILEKQAKEESVPEVGSRPCVSTAQDEAEHSQELQYATPVFQEVAPREQDFLTVWRPGNYCCDCCVVASATAASHPETSPQWRRALPLQTLASQPQHFAPNPSLDTSLVEDTHIPDPRNTVTIIFSVSDPTK